jgi:cobalt-zinc-cadmium resistance protein CzcA
VEIKVFYNRAELVEKAVGTVSKALMEATVLVLVLLGAFPRQPARRRHGGRGAAAVGAGHLHPDALAGMSANLMSLGGLAIALGMLVDAAVVVVENIVQHLATTAPRASCRGCTSCSARCARWPHRWPPAS